ncbi:MAG: hypothetical protein ACKPKO_29625 [Candidatus Fonsibacter sp.]
MYHCITRFLNEPTDLLGGCDLDAFAFASDFASAFGFASVFAFAFALGK